MSALARRQLNQTKKELERDQRKAARAKLQALRAEIRSARQRRREKLRAVGTSCRTARTVISERAKKARARLSDSIKRTRDKARSLCSSARGSARLETLLDIDKAIGKLQEEQAEQARLRAWTDRRKPKGAVVRSAREVRSESDDEVLANLDDPGLQVVWEKVKHRIKPGRHRSRTEAFAEWAAEHVSDVYRIQEADAEAHLLKLERDERRLAGALAKPGRYREPAGLEAVPF